MKVAALIFATVLQLATAFYSPSHQHNLARPSSTLLEASPHLIGESMVALVTPMSEDNKVDVGALRSLLEWHVECGTRAIVVLGTTGEASTLSPSERDTVLSETVSVVDGKAAVVVGTGTIDTAATIETTKRAAELGADSSLVVTPYYVKPTQHGLVKHFEAVASAVDLPMIVYNVPGRTGVDLKPETVAILSKHPGIVGIKEATGDNSRVATLRAECGDDFLLLSGEDSASLDFVLKGGDGVISVTSNIAPREMQEMMALARAGSSEEAKTIDDKLAGLHDKLFCEANPIPAKWALYRAGKIGPGIRLPLTELSERYHADLEEAMTAAGLVLSSS